VGDDVAGGIEEGGGADAADKALHCPICLVRVPSTLENCPSTPCLLCMAYGSAGCGSS
jgi:hypothetical protein